MSLFPTVLRAMRPSWMEQQLKMMQQLESAMSSSFLHHPSFHVEWRVPDDDKALLKNSEAVEKKNQPFKLQMDVKNFAPKEITVKAIDSDIIIEGKHEENSDEKGYISRHFVRSFRLPEGHFAEDVVSTLEAGVLTISAPNRMIDEKQAKEIPIEIKEKIAVENKAESVMVSPKHELK